MKRNILFVAFALLICSGAFAQVQPTPGVIPPFSTIETHEYDSVNLATLGIQLNVPVRSKAGHIPFSFALKGMAQIQYMTVSNPPPNTPPHYFAGAPGLAGQENHIGGGPPRVQSSIVIGPCGLGGGWIYYDAAGTGHPTSIGYLEPPSCGTSNSGASYTTDGSGIYVSLSYSPTLGGYAIDANGNKTIFFSPDSFSDPNGKSLSTTRTTNGSIITTTFADTLTAPQTTLTSVATYTPPGPSPVLKSEPEPANSIVEQETDTWTDAVGGDQSVTLTPESLPILTAFGCANLDQTTAFNVEFPSSVSFPDSSTLSFGWEKTYSNSADYTGRLASLTLPTGGTISYAYSGGSHGINCVDGTPATMTRTTPDGMWKYVHTAPPSYGRSPTTTQVTDPQGNNVVYTFVMAATLAGLASYPNPVETEKQVYNCCSVSSATLIETVITCYNNPGSTPTNCNPSSLALPITEKDVYTTYPGVTGYAAVKTTYDTYGRVTDVQSYDFNAANPTNEKKIAYGSGNPTSQACTAIGSYIIAKPCTVTLYDSQNGNAVLSQTWNSYDQYGNLAQTWSLVSGTGASGKYLSKSYTYSQGVVQTATDVNGEVTMYTPTSCNDMFVTSQYPKDFPNLVTSQVWDCNGGVVTSSTDANGQKTHVDYSPPDPFYRPVDSKDELNNVTTFAYTPKSTESVFLFNNGASVIDTLSTTDSIGRPATSQIRQGPAPNPNWDTKSRTFDSDGRVYETSLTCVKGAGLPCSASTETQTYDALNRPWVHTGTGGDIITKTYLANDVLTKLTPVPSGENAKETQKEYDGLGRLKSVCVISSASGSGPCGQTTPATGFLTTYTYDGAGRLLQTLENAQVASLTQKRTYTYDLLGRMLSETHPESGQKQYFWDTTAPDCGNGIGGQMSEKIDNSGIITCYYYDLLNRIQAIEAGYRQPTPICKVFAYDSLSYPTAKVPPSGVTLSNPLGRMIEAYTENCSTGALITDEWFLYEQRGLMSAYYQMSPSSQGYYALSATYWADHSLETVSGVGLPTLTYGTLDGEGRVQTVSASGTNPVSAVTYNNGPGPDDSIGALLTTTLGAGDKQAFTYDPNTGRMASYSASVGATPVVISGTLHWNPNGTLYTNNIVDQYNPADTQLCTYLYDDFIRVAGTTTPTTPGVNCLNGATKVWNQTFSYDQFGNITKSTTGPGLSWACAACYNTATNQYNSVLSGSIAYDTDGNLTDDTFHTYTWLADGHVATIATPPHGSTIATVTYDANGNKVEENVGGVIHEYVSAFGVSAQMTGLTESATNVDLPGGVQAIYSGGTLKRFRFPDWQGTIRAESDPTARLFTESLAFAPFGERYALKGAPFNVDSFTGKPDQLVSDEYDFLAREEHNGQGRWVSPDPMRGTGNKYVYADNNPLSKVDLYGLVSITIDDGLDMGGLDASVGGGDRFDTSFHSESYSATTAEARSEALFICTSIDCSGPGTRAMLEGLGLIKAEPVGVATWSTQQSDITGAGMAAGQSAKQAQNTSQPVLMAQNQDPNQSQSSSSSSSGSGRVNSPAQGQQPDTTVTIPSNKPGETTERTYGPDGRAVKDVDSGHAHDPEPHAHDWDWSKTPPRQPRRDLTPDEAAGKKSTILDWAGEHKGALITGGVIVGIGATILTGGAAAPALAFVF